MSSGEVRRRLVVCCDGTWNHPDELADGSLAPTNVAKLAMGVARHDRSGLPQLVYYQSGVGTLGSQRFRGGVFGYGLSRNVRECYRFLIETYEPGDELYFFGFSRGAYTARSTVGLIHNCGILRPEHSGRINDAYRLYKSESPDKKPHAIAAKLFRRSYCYDADDVPIHFVGVWDTVGALGVPIDGVWMPGFIKKKYGFHDTELNNRVRNAYQALAIDEHRGPFKPAVWTRDPQVPGEAPEQVLQQVWFAGVHRDVGGGEANPALSEIPLMWMVNRARSCGLEFKPHHFVRKSTPKTPKPEDTMGRALGDWVDPNPFGLEHQSLKGFYKRLPPNPRTIGVARNGVEQAASSAVDRLGYEDDTGKPYQPPNLTDWIAQGHHEAVAVLGDGELVDPYPPQTPGEIGPMPTD